MKYLLILFILLSGCVKPVQEPIRAEIPLAKLNLPTGIKYSKVLKVYHNGIDTDNNNDGISDCFYDRQFIENWDEIKK